MPEIVCIKVILIGDFKAAGLVEPVGRTAVKGHEPDRELARLRIGFDLVDNSPTNAAALAFWVNIKVIKIQVVFPVSDNEEADLLVILVNDLRVGRTEGCQKPFSRPDGVKAANGFQAGAHCPNA